MLPCVGAGGALVGSTTAPRGGGQRHTNSSQQDSTSHQVAASRVAAWAWPLACRVAQSRRRLVGSSLARLEQLLQARAAMRRETESRDRVRLIPYARVGSSLEPSLANSASGLGNRDYIAFFPFQ